MTIIHLFKIKKVIQSTLHLRLYISLVASHNLPFINFSNYVY